MAKEIAENVPAVENALVVENALAVESGDDEGDRPQPLRRLLLLFLMLLLEFEPFDPPEERDLMAFDADTRHFLLIRNLHMADFITLLNGFSGFYLIVLCLRYTLTGSTHYVQRANMFIVLGLFFDFFDGRVARMRNKLLLMGQELDLLADLVLFGVAPALIAFAIGFRSTVDTLMLTFFVLCGLTRLARFNVTVAKLPKDHTGKSKYFEGTPIPTLLTLVGTMAYWIHKGWMLDQLPAGVWLTNTFFEFHPAALLFVINGCGMVSKSLHIPKP